ncbi:hypothetical protein [Paenibacillus faecalis]|uniref:hypothetical protein n=1 Tax=Paenibacillus faecalis TaxID=2079532 RepID=UPI00131A5FC1|nr:hypothetical protein [Paenibacillus faecalis]
MSKKYSKTVAFVVVFFVLLSIFLLFNNGGFNNKSKNKVSSYYASFISSVQSLDLALAQIDEDQEPDEIAVRMFDVYTYINFVNDRLDLLIDNTDNSLELDTLKNDLSLLKNYYEPLVRKQISNKDESNLQAHNEFKKQIHLFNEALPKEFKNTKDFAQDFNKAAKHIKPIIN